MITFEDFDEHVRQCSYCELIGDRYECCSFGNDFFLNQLRDGGIIDTDGNILDSDGSVLITQDRRLTSTPE